MTEIKQYTVCDGVGFRSIEDTRFKTMRIAVNFLVPLDEKYQVAARALLPFLLTRASREYPDFTKMSARLAELYGASLSADVQKMGDTQVISVCATGLADDYTLEGGGISGDLAELLCSVLFQPLLVDGLFPADGFEQERRQTIELIDSEFNDKRVYAKQRCEQILCEGEPYSVSRYGSRDSILSLKREDMTAIWRDLLRRARIEIMALGSCDPQPIRERFQKAFESVERDPVRSFPVLCPEAKSEVRVETERMEVAQSKLVLGFRTGEIAEQDRPAFRLMTALWGGTPHSKLFLNVREKLSLCYYCSARCNVNKGFLLVESGVETQNIEPAKKEILAQLEEVQLGRFTEEELAAAKLSLCNNYRTIKDYLGGLESFYLSQIFNETVQTPEEAAQEISRVTAEQVTEAAKRVRLDTEYRLVGGEEEHA